MLIDVKQFQAGASHASRDLTCSLDLGIIPDTLQQAIGNPWCAAASLRDFIAAFRSNRCIQDFCRTANDVFKFRNCIKIEPVDHPKTRSERRGDQTCASGCADKSETAKIQTMGARSRPLTDDDVQFEVLHCRIEYFFDVRLQAMNFINKQNIPEFKVR